ncbi:MAG: hypothetical protein NT013_26030, partial [Planctomycetia bacterium]|nr:hypothetical protein [Planctomycetia bacterium]
PEPRPSIGLSILSQVNHQLESRMRETRPSGLEGGATELNRSFLPLSKVQESLDEPDEEIADESP